MLLHSTPRTICTSVQEPGGFLPLSLTSHLILGCHGMGLQQWSRRQGYPEQGSVATQRQDGQGTGKFPIAVTSLSTM